MKRLFPLFFLFAACGEQLDGRILDECEEFFGTSGCVADGLNATCDGNENGRIVLRGASETTAEIYFQGYNGLMSFLAYADLEGDNVRIVFGVKPARKE